MVTFSGGVGRTWLPGTIEIAAELDQLGNANLEGYLLQTTWQMVPMVRDESHLFSCA